MGAAEKWAPDATPLVLVLAEALSSPPVDFGTVAASWVRGGQGTSGPPTEPTARLLGHLARAQRPPVPADGLTTLVGLPLALPAALATFQAPRDLLGTAYHAARLTSADERVTWGAVAIAVAAARFLLDKRDFIPDVIEALAVNSAPPGLLEAIRKVPVLRPDSNGRLPLPGDDPATRGVIAALWLADREPNPARAAAWLDSGAGADGHAAVAAAGLLAARGGWTGTTAEPALDGGLRQHCDDIAARLAGPTRFSAPT